MNTHTEGPWEVIIDDSGGQWTGWPLSIESVNEEDKTVVRTGGQWPYQWDTATSQNEAVANAYIIAAAPDLLEALEELVACENDMSINAYKYKERAITAAKKAINKALNIKG